MDCSSFFGAIPNGGTSVKNLFHDFGLLTPPKAGFAIPVMDSFSQKPISLRDIIFFFFYHL